MLSKTSLTRIGTYSNNNYNRLKIEKIKVKLLGNTKRAISIISVSNQVMFTILIKIRGMQTS